MNKRYIEESFPLKEVSAEAAYEKLIRLGNINSIHLWWARRPLASSRATSYSALIDLPEDLNEWNNEWNYIYDLSKWKNRLNSNLLSKAKKNISKIFRKEPPKILDPFTGGGAIPLEAARLGCDTYATEYNPVAIILSKCTIEYPQTYNEKLLNDVKKWGTWLIKQVKKEIGQFFLGKKRSIKTGLVADNIEEEVIQNFIWANTIKCQNPLCEGEIPLIRQYWLAKKKNGKKISLYPYIEKNEIKFRIVGTGYSAIPDGFDPSKGSVSKAIVECPICNSIINANDLRSLFSNGKSGERLIAVVYYIKNQKKTGKKYRIATNFDREKYEKAKEYLLNEIEDLRLEWGLEPVPDEILPPPNTLGFRVQRYGILKWGQLFNARQNLVLITICKKIRQCYDKLLKADYDIKYAKAIITYLSLGLDRIADRNSVLSTWNNVAEKQSHTYVRQALPMVWDYAEVNVINGAQGWERQFSYTVKALENLIPLNNPAKIIQSSATELPFEDNFFDAIFTDPPYYDNIPYSHLSDYFYVWLKRSIGPVYPELFSTPLTPKSKEIVAYGENGFDFFDKMLKDSFMEMHRVLKKDGIGIIVYAHKTTKGWETVINSLIESGLSVTASWPISTELTARIRAMKSATLASSIYIVVRKKKKEEIGFYQEVKKELNDYLKLSLGKLWDIGFSGADFFISAIGAGLEIFGRFEKILDFEGNHIKADILLEDIRKIVINYAIHQILHNGFSEKISGLTRFYILWRWNYQDLKLDFDEAKKLAHAVGISLEKEWNKGFIKKNGKYISLLGPKQRKIEDIEKSEELIDIIHYLLLLWELERKDEMTEIISRVIGEEEIIYRISQAISQSLPNNNKEKKLIDGFLSGKERIKESIKESRSQDKIDRWTK
ncbi:MAG: DUF1156 domain-containing protein [Promethearchaeota archaeon]